VDGTVREWNTVFGLTIPSGQGAIRAVAFSSDNQTMASGGTDGTVKLWNAGTARVVRQLGAAVPTPNDFHAINGLAFSKDGSRIVAASSDGRVSLWNTVTGQLIAELLPKRGTQGESRMQSAAFDGDGKYIAAAGHEGIVWLWDAETLAPIATLRAERTEGSRKVPYQVWSVAFSPDGRRLATGSGFDRMQPPPPKRSNLIQLWDLDSFTADGEPMHYKTEATIYALDFDTDERIVAGSSDGTIRVWDVESREIVPEPLFKDQNAVHSLALAHRDRWIATGGGGGVVRVWDMETEPEKDASLEGHRDLVQGVAISPNDSLIVSGSTDGKLRLWPGPGDVGEILCSKLTSDARPEQWDEWVGEKADYKELCSRSATA
jgi:WD40 repeat protein